MSSTILRRSEKKILNEVNKKIKFPQGKLNNNNNNQNKILNK